MYFASHTLPHVPISAQAFEDLQQNFSQLLGKLGTSHGKISNRSIECWSCRTLIHWNGFVDPNLAE